MSVNRSRGSSNSLDLLYTDPHRLSQVNGFIGFQKTKISELPSLNHAGSLTTDTKRVHILGHKNADLVRLGFCTQLNGT